MTIRELLEKELFKVIVEGTELDVTISEVFCCDLLSVAMTRAPMHGVWVTVMGNMNTLAVAALTEVGCIILAESAAIDDVAIQKAKLEGITVLSTEKAIFEAATDVHQLL